MGNRWGNFVVCDKNSYARLMSGAGNLKGELGPPVTPVEAKRAASAR
jgi:hypothetical protein